MYTPEEIIESGGMRLKVVSAGFHLLYHQAAWSYDLVAAAVSRGQWAEWVRAALPFVRGVDVLELGHGPGHLLWELRLAGRRAVGIDASAQMGRIARRNLLARSKAWTELVRAYAQALPFPDDSFDSVVSTFPTPYIAAAGTLAEVARVLRPGGRLVVVPEAWLTTRGPVTGLIDRLYRLTGQRGSQAGPDVPGPWVASLSAAAAAAGLTPQTHLVDLPRSQVRVVVGTAAGD